MTDYPIKLDGARWKYLKISPTIANLYRGSSGVAIVCASCFNGRGFGNPGLPNYFKNHWHLTLLEIEKVSRCGFCGKMNARAYPWWAGEGAGPLGLEGPPRSRETLSA